MSLSFWSQSLDEYGESVLVDEGEELSPNDLARADLVVERIRVVREKGIQQQTDHTEVQGWRHRQEFVLRLICVETDFKGRDAPLMAHGAIPSGRAGWIDSVLDEIDSFLTRVKRSISSSARCSLVALLEELQKKGSRSKLGDRLERISPRRRAAVLTGALLVSLAAALFLARSCFSP